jgi:hypothetical protein
MNSRVIKFTNPREFISRAYNPNLDKRFFMDFSCTNYKILINL